MKKLAYILIIVAGLCNYAQGQDIPRGTSLFFVGYQVSVPTNANYLTSTSWSGFQFDYHYMVKPNMSLGFGTSYNSFSQHFAKETYQRGDGTGAITSDMIRHVYTAPLTVQGRYYFSGGKRLKPYVGLGLGAEYSEQNAYFNIYVVNAKNWGFVVRPEAGALAQFSPGVGGYISIAYNYATNSEPDFHISSLSQIPISIGLIFSAR